MLAAVALLLAAMWLRQGLVTVTFEAVPPEVVEVQAFVWRDGRAPERMDVSTARQGDRVLLTGSPRASVIVTFRRADQAYAIDGPSAWTTTPRRTMRGAAWRRTYGGIAPAGAAAGAVVEWTTVAGRGPWPRCLIRGLAWECWGVAADDRGVVTIAGGARLWWGAAVPQVDGPLRSAAWGRLLLIRDSSAQPPRLKATFARPVTPASLRFAAIRLETAPVSNTSAVQLAPGAIWATGEDVPANGWVEVRSSIGGPAFLGIEELAAGAATNPVAVRLADTRVLNGAVTDAKGHPAPRALVTLFRLIEPLQAASSKLKARRVLAGEVTADDEGEFVVEDVGEADYEIVAWHPQMGRASAAVGMLQSRVDVRLSTPSLARGRVVSRGRAVAGVDVISVPDATTFTESRDLTEVKGGDARTGADGRFAVMLAPSGGGELRIGGGRYAVMRVPLPSTPAASVDLGDVEIAAPISLIAAVEGDPGCVLQAIGPIGRMGLQLVTGSRDPAGYRISMPEAGLWQFGLACPAGRRSLTPDSVSVTPALDGTLIRFVVR